MKDNQLLKASVILGLVLTVVTILNMGLSTYVLYSTA